MQTQQTTRSAVDRIGDVLGLVAIGVCLLYDVWADIRYVVVPLVHHQAVDWLSGAVYLVLTAWIGWLCGIQVGRIRKYHTTSWFFINLGHVLRSVFIKLSCWWLERQVAFLNWVMRRWYGPETTEVALCTMEVTLSDTPLTYDDDILRGEDYTPTLFAAHPAVIYPASLFTESDVDWLDE